MLCPAYSAPLLELHPALVLARPHPRLPFAGTGGIEHIPQHSWCGVDSTKENRRQLWFCSALFELCFLASWNQDMQSTIQSTLERNWRSVGSTSSILATAQFEDGCRKLCEVQKIASSAADSSKLSNDKFGANCTKHAARHQRTSSLSPSLWLGKTLGDITLCRLQNQEIICKESGSPPLFLFTWNKARL